MSTVDLSKLGNIINDGTNGQVLTSQGGSAFSFADAAAGGASVTSSDTAPSSPSAGDLWFDSTTGELLVWYVDGSSNQWVGVSGTAGPQGAAGSSVTSYAAPTNFPSSGNSVGDFAFATNAPKALYVWDGSEWDRIWSGGQEGGPTFTTSPSSSYTLSGGANTDVTVAASDPDGFPITYSVVTNPTNQAQATITQPSTGLFRFAASNTSSNAGSFTAKFVADDGVQKTTTSSSLLLSFDPTLSAPIRMGFNNNLTNSGTNSSVSAALSTGGAQTYSTSIKKIGTHSIDFGNNNNGAVTVSGYTASTTYSIGMWFYLNTYSVSSASRYLFRSEDLGVSNGQSLYASAGSPNSAAFWFADGVTDYNGASATITGQTWHHVVMTSGSNGTKLYFNGSLLDSGSGTKTLEPTIVIGDIPANRNATSSIYNLKGAVDNFFVHGSELTSTEVSAIYNDTSTNF